MTQEEELLQEIASNTRVIAQLLAISVATELRERLAGILETEQKRTAYLASDGGRSAREVGRLAGTTHKTVGRWWSEWQALGIAKDAEDGRSRALLDVSLFALAIEGGGRQ